MKVAIVGYGVEGQAAVQYWRRAGHDITICDQNPVLDFPAGIDIHLQTGDVYLQDLDRFDLVVRSPGLRPDALIAAGASADKITTVSNEFLHVCPTRNIIGVTGTKGKGTTSSLIAALLQAAGRRVHLGGNIGVPALALLDGDIKYDDWVVLEMSSFQLIDLQRSPRIGVCLMVVPEHLDWHTDVAEYVAAKQQMFRWQTPNDVAIYYPQSEFSTQIASVSPGKHIPYLEPPGAYVEDNAIKLGGQIICRTDELQLLGRHNWQNVCAALTAVSQVTNETENLHHAVTQFSGLEHRLQLVRELDGVRYYDDSFGTTPETAQVAIEAFDQPKVLILGGSDKGADYSFLAQTIATTNIRAILLIGDQAERLAAALEAAGVTNHQPGGADMPSIVANARAAAQSGDVVLLSTGCASFGMFKNYKDRGEQFTQAVQALA